MGEIYPYKVEVTGSNPVVRTILPVNSVVECSTVNRNVVGSNPTRAANHIIV